MWQSRIEIKHRSIFYVLWITVPHPKNCSGEVLFLPKMKLVENMSCFSRTVWLLWYMLLCWKRWFSCKWEYGSQDEKHDKVSVFSILFYIAKWESHGNCFFSDQDPWLIQQYCNIFPLFIDCTHSYCGLRVVKWLGYHYSLVCFV